MRIQGALVFLIVLLACAVLIAPWEGQLFAQDPRGTIVGRVVDPTGAVIPGVVIQVVSKTMGTRVVVQTNENNYEFTDEQNCSGTSSGKLYTVEKHGYTDPVDIPWP